jgi:hypothetical protein
MHSSVLRNKKYIQFSEENTVEGSRARSPRGGDEEEDPRADTYEAKDEDGNKVQRLVSWPNLTFEQVQALRQSKAGQYNNTGAIPFTCLVDPHTLEEITRWKGGRSATTIMDAVTAARKELSKKYGPSPSRSVLAKFRSQEADIRAALAKYGTGPRR